MTSHLDAPALRAAGRAPPLPAQLALAQAPALMLDSLLRVLPGQRLVFRAADSSGRKLLVKVFLGRRASRHLQRELDGHRRLSAAGVLTPGLCGRGPLCGGGQVLQQDWLDAAESAAERFAAAADPAQTQERAQAQTQEQVLADVLGLVVQLHRAGVRQADLHLDNFLYTPDGRLWCVDAAAVVPAAAGDAALVDQVATLHGQLPVACDELLPASLAACAAALGRPLAAGASAGAEEAVLAARQLVLADYAGKTRRDCSLFAVGRAAGCWWARPRPTAAAAAVALAQALNAWQQAPDASMAAGQLLKDGNSATVVALQLAGNSLVQKRYNLKTLGHRLRRAVQLSRAERAWSLGHCLLRAGVATAAPVAVAVARWGPLRGRAWLLSTAVSGPDLATLWADRAPTGPELAALAQLLLGLGRAGASHGDLKASNLLWGPEGPLFIDLDAARLHRKPGQQQRALARDFRRLQANWPQGHPAHGPVAEMLARVSVSLGLQTGAEA